MCFLTKWQEVVTLNIWTLCLPTLFWKMYTLSKQYMIKGKKVRPIRKGQKSLRKKSANNFPVCEGEKKTFWKPRWDNCMLIAYQLDTVKWCQWAPQIAVIFCFHEVLKLSFYSIHHPFPAIEFHYPLFLSEIIAQIQRPN